MLGLSHISTSYSGNKRGCVDVSFSVSVGEVVSVLGINGAGKTTLFNTLAMYYAPDSGDAEIAGYSIRTQALQAKAQVGVLFEQNPLYPEMRVRDFLFFSAQMYGFSRADFEKRLEDVARLFDLSAVLDSRIAALSKGFKQRVGLARAVFHRPQVLLLDEATSGLDAVQVRLFCETIQELKKECAIVLATHNLSLAAKLCDRHVLLHKGEVIAQGSISTIAEAYNIEATASAESVLQTAFYRSVGLEAGAFGGQEHETE